MTDAGSRDALSPSSPGGDRHPPARPTRVVIVENSATMRELLADGLQARGLQVVGTAADGMEALDVIRRTQPDAVSLDYMMPRLDGLGVLRALQDEQAMVPAVIVSSMTAVAAEHAVDMLTEGAVDVVPKPLPGSSPKTFLDDLGRQLEMAASTAVVDPANSASSARAAPRSAGSGHGDSRGRIARRRIVLVAASTGGPQALRCLLHRLPERVGGGMIIVQHMPEQFTRSLAERLDTRAALQVREADEGDLLEGGCALVAPGNRHVRIRRDGRIRLTSDPRIGGLRPRADVTAADAAEHFGKRVILVVLTGMGRDGLEGARRVKEHGGMVIAESEESAVVYGMPRAVVEAGLADEELPLVQIAHLITDEAGW